MEVKRYHGIIEEVGNTPTKSLHLPDWNLSYVEFLHGTQMREYRDALARTKVRIVQVTDMRIYFQDDSNKHSTKKT